MVPCRLQSPFLKINFPEKKFYRQRASIKGKVLPQAEAKKSFGFF
jgi:hypothetical protein